MLTGVAASLFAAVAKTGKSLTNKVAIGRTDEYVASAAYRGVTFLILLAFLAVTGGLFLPESDTYWIALVANTGLFTLHTLLLARAYKHADVSIVMPLLSLSTVVVLLPAWLLLGESPTVVGMGGIILCTVGAYALNIADASVTDPLAPFRRLLDNRGAQYMLVDLLVIAAIPPIDKIGLQHSTPLFWVFSIHAGTAVALVAFALYWSPDWRQHLDGNATLLVGLGVVNVLVWAGQSYAYALTQVAYVQAIKQSSLVFTVIAGHHFFDEPHIRSRLLGAVLILAGVLLVILAV